MKRLFILISTLIAALAKQQNTQTQSESYLIFKNTCYNVIFKQFDFQNAQCLKLMSSKLIGVYIIFGALVSRVPQIIKIIQTKSVRSLSLNSVILQQATQTCSMAYNIFKQHPFTLFGQSIVLNLQMIVIHLLFIVFGQQGRIKSIVTFPILIIFFFAGYFVDFGLFPDYILQNSIIIQILLILASNLSQIYEIHKRKSIGSLAFIPYGSTVLGSSVRIYTILIQTEGDYLMLSSFFIALITNLYICMCFVIFKQKESETRKIKQT